MTEGLRLMHEAHDQFTILNKTIRTTAGPRIIQLTISLLYYRPVFEPAFARHYLTRLCSQAASTLGSHGQSHMVSITWPWLPSELPNIAVNRCLKFLQLTFTILHCPSQ